jgi:hypothetical protein
MQETKLSFKKIFVSKNTFWNYKNIVRYEVEKEGEIIGRIEINSTYTATIDYDSRTYHIKASTRLFVVRKLEVFLSENLKIGEIDYWRRTPRISIYQTNRNDTWEFDENKPSFFGNRKNEYTTFLKGDNGIISYKIELGNFFSDKNKNDCLRELNGIVNFGGQSSLIAILGIYINELLIFEEMEK